MNAAGSRFELDGVSHDRQGGKLGVVDHLVEPACSHFGEAVEVMGFNDWGSGDTYGAKRRRRLLGRKGSCPGFDSTVYPVVVFVAAVDGLHLSNGREVGR